MTARDTRDRPDAPSPSTGPPSFLRRHPILAAFGVLAGLSLFATYWPASAIIVGVVAGARATGLDRKAWVEARSLGRAVVARLRKRRAGKPSSPAPVGPTSGAPQPAAPGQDGVSGPSAHAPLAAMPGRGPGSAAVERQRPTRRPRSPAEVSGTGVRGPAD